MRRIIRCSSLSRRGVGEAAGLATARRAAVDSDENARNVLGYVVSLIHCLHVGVVLPVTVPVV